MQIVRRGTKAKRVYGGTKKTTSQVDIFIIQNRPTTVRIHLKLSSLLEEEGLSLKKN